MFALTPVPPPPITHRLSEDIQALLVAPLFMALAASFLRRAELLTGGTVVNHRPGRYMEV